MIYHWFSLRYICYICYGGKRWPRIFSRYLCFFWSYHSQCIFHLLLSLCWFLHGTGKNLFLSFHILNVEKDDLSLIFPSLYLLRRKKMAQNFFSLLLFLLESSFLVYFPFVTFVKLISTWTIKTLLLSFNIANVEKADLSLIFPSLSLLRGEKMAQIFSRSSCFFWSHHSLCMLLSLRWFQNGPGKNLLLLFHILNIEKDDLSLIFPSLHSLRLLRGKRWPKIFSCYFCFFWSHHSQCIFHLLFLLHWFLHEPGKNLLLSFHILNHEKADLSLIFPSLCLLHWLQRKKMAQNFFSLPLFLQESSLSVYFPFITFVMLISTWTRKDLLLWFHILNVEKADLSLIFPSLDFITFVTGKNMAQNFFSLPLFLLESYFSVYFPFITFVMLISTWTKKNPVIFVSYCKCWKDWFIIDFPFVPFVTGEKDDPEFFLVLLFLLESSLSMYFPFVTLVTLILKWTRKKPVSFVSYFKCWKRWFIIDFPFVTFVTRKKMAQNFFSLPLFHLESSLSVYFPFITFVTLISTWTKKNPVTFVSYCKCWKGWFIIDFPLVMFFMFVTWEKMAQNFFSLPLFLLESSLSVYFPIFAFLMLISKWTRKKPVTFVSYF